jgi:O-succinylbenzoic acid--CoA ligase
MTRALRVVSAGEAAVAIRDALAGPGDAVFVGEPQPDLPETVAQRVALVVQSSGSTGHPKRVALSSDALLASAAASESSLGEPGQWLLALPLTYIAGINVVVRALAAQTELIELDGGKFTPEAFIEAAGRMTEHARFVSLVPAQLSTLLDSDVAARALAGFARVLVGGQATPTALLDRAAAAGVLITRTYGSSETSGGCVYDGTPIGTTLVRTVDGEIELAGPSLAEGYLGDPARTDAAFHVEDGVRWYRTGDTGAVENGLLRVTGRLDDVIISGGLKVSLGEVETVVRAIDGLEQAIVVRAHSERWGEVPVVVTTSAVDLAHVRSVVGDALGVAAAPAAIEVVDTVPTLASGKPDRARLTARIAR